MSPNMAYARRMNCTEAAAVAEGFCCDCGETHRFDGYFYAHTNVSLEFVCSNSKSVFLFGNLRGYRKKRGKDAPRDYQMRMYSQRRDGGEHDGDRNRASKRPVRQGGFN